MTILEILEAHTQSIRNGRCSCEDRGPKRTWLEHRDHLAEVLERLMQEREAEAWDRLVGYAPFTAFERVRLRCENPFREEPNDD